MNNPITKIKDYMTKNGLRLIDFFKQMDKDQSNTITFDEFKRGVQVHIKSKSLLLLVHAAIPIFVSSFFQQFQLEMSDADIRRAINILDTDKSGDIDFQ